ncbi:MAG: hypothetical protein HY901_36185 [Deltaproteobacteria bacterium]|nr:hypothetical protein [Deltaproteobacteria bacterium]
MRIKGRIAGVALGLLLVAGVAVAAPRQGETLTVKALNVNLMSGKSLLSARVGSSPLDRGAHVRFVEASADWYKVTTSDNRTGWLKKSALEERNVVLSKKIGGEGVQVSQHEVETAGRGFTKEVEAEYKGSRSNLTPGYAALDRIEKHTVDPQAANGFAKEGELAHDESAGGGR